MKKLIHFLQAGRLVNLDNFSVHTIASVLKKFLRKIPGGIFGRGGEQRLFAVIDLPTIEEQRDQIHRLEFSYFDTSAFMFAYWTFPLTLEIEMMHLYEMANIFQTV
jgi:hypothetical protein